MLLARNRRPPADLSPGAEARGVTILELLAAVAVIGVLLAIGGFALRSAADSAANSVTLSRLRQHLVTFQLYSQDFDQRFPLIMKPGQPWEDVQFGSYTVTTDYFGAYFAWPYALAPLYYEDDPQSAVFQSVQSVASRGARGTHPSFWYSNSFLADPKFWAPETRTGPSQWRATRQDEVRFNGLKVLLYTHISTQARGRNVQRPLGFCDGSARNISASQMRAAYPNANGAWPGRAHFGRGVPGMHTINGVHGRDID